MKLIELKPCGCGGTDKTDPLARLCLQHTLELARNLLGGAMIEIDSRTGPGPIHYTGTWRDAYADCRRQLGVALSWVVDAQRSLGFTK